MGPIETWKYVLPKEVFQGVEENPDNLGFCVNGNCNPGGVLNLTTCLNDTLGVTLPYLMSKPHLLDADQIFHDQLEGLSPSDELHGTRLYAEPVTGFVLRKKKIQKFRVKFLDICFNIFLLFFLKIYLFFFGEISVDFLKSNCILLQVIF